MSEVTKKQIVRTTRETKQPQGIEAGAHFSSTPQDSHEKFSNSVQGHVWCVWCLPCPQTLLVTKAAADAEQSCNRCGRDDAGPFLPAVTAEDEQQNTLELQQNVSFHDRDHKPLQHPKLCPSQLFTIIKISENALKPRTYSNSGLRVVCDQIVPSWITASRSMGWEDHMRNTCYLWLWHTSPTACSLLHLGSKIIHIIWGHASFLVTKST